MSSPGLVCVDLNASTLADAALNVAVFIAVAACPAPLNISLAMKLREGLSYIFADDPALLHEMLDNWRDLYVALLGELTRQVQAPKRHRAASMAPAAPCRRHVPSAGRRR